MKHARFGTKLTLHQFANNWITASDDEGKQWTLKPESVELESEEEAERFRSEPHSGQFWNWYEFRPGDRSFKRKRSK